MRRELSEPSSSRLALAVMWQPALGEERALAEVEAVFGKIETRTPAFDFSFTAYYAREMGEGLRKCFVAVEGTVGRDSLPKFKHLAVSLEFRHFRNEARLLNVDPMLISLENIVVASSKNFPHRIYLGKGVFGDLALIRRKSGFDSLPWTYPDYVQERDFFEALHNSLRSG